MTYTVSQLISSAYYTSGIVSRQLQTVTGQQSSDGLRLLNEVLSVKSSYNKLIPYFKRSTFTAVIGQEDYEIDNLISLETLVFNIGAVRYPMTDMGRKDYLGSARIDSVQSLPMEYHLERNFGGATIFMYPLPQAAYVFTMWGKFGFDVVTAGEDLSAVYDMDYITYLKYALADYICDYNSISLPPGTAKKLEELENKLSDKSPVDYSTRKASTMQRGSSTNWAFINLGRGGFWPS